MCEVEVTSVDWRVLPTAHGGIGGGAGVIRAALAVQNLAEI